MFLLFIFFFTIERYYSILYVKIYILSDCFTRLFSAVSNHGCIAIPVTEVTLYLCSCLFTVDIKEQICDKKTGDTRPPFIEMQTKFIGNKTLKLKLLEDNQSDYS